MQQRRNGSVTPRGVLFWLSTSIWRKALTDLNNLVQQLLNTPIANKSYVVDYQLLCYFVREFFTCDGTTIPAASRKRRMVDPR